MTLQLPLFPPQSTWVPPDMGKLPNWEGAKRVAIDIETCDPYLKQLGPSVRRGGFIAGVAFAIEDGPAHYLPYKHQGGDNLPEDAVLRYLLDQSIAFRGEIVGANLNYDMDYLMEAGIHFPNVKGWRDTQIADPLINELHDRYSLEHIAQRWGLPGKDETLLNEACRNFSIKKDELWKLPARFVGAYGEQDARLPLTLLRRQERVIDEVGLWDIYNLESELQPVLLRMRRHGVRIDFEALGKVEAWCLEEELKALAIVKHNTGVKIQPDDVWKKPGIVAALTSIGIALGQTPTGQPQVDKDVLDGIDHPVAEAILHARKLNKIRTTFAASIREHAIGDRIHCTFNQLRRAREDGDEVGAAWGRTSSENPNLQQQPRRDKIAKIWRSIYIPDEGCEWLTADYSQQEPRLLTHFAEIMNLPKAHEAAEKYRNDPTTDNHQMMADMCGIDRTPAKDIYLGLCYSMGGAKLAHELGLPTKMVMIKGKLKEVAGDEAQALLDKFNTHAPFVKKLAEQCEKVGNERGYIITLLGRHCHFPQRPDGSYDWTHKALNRLIQGSAGDQTKKAMVEVAKAGLPLQLQVHDELDASVKTREEGEAIADIMRHCVKLNVPSRVDVGFGTNWAGAK